MMRAEFRVAGRYTEPQTATETTRQRRKRDETTKDPDGRANMELTRPAARVARPRSGPLQGAVRVTIPGGALHANAGDLVVMLARARPGLFGPDKSQPSTRSRP